MSELAPQGRRWAEEQIGTKVLSAFEISGATTAKIYLLTTEEVEYVMKQFVHDGFVSEQPDRAVHEAGGAQAALRSGLPVPRVIGLDPDGQASGFPSVVMTKLPGQRLASIGAPEAIAEVLAQIHQLQAQVPWKYQRYNGPEALYPPSWTTKPDLWERAFEAISEATPPAPEGFIHRDFHHDNLLWVGNRVTGIVDWLSACMGPFGIDLARCRLNLAWIGDRAGSRRFLEEYRRLGEPDAPNPYWELVDAIDSLPYYEGPVAVDRWPLPRSPEAVRDRHEEFIAEALSRLE